MILGCFAPFMVFALEAEETRATTLLRTSLSSLPFVAHSFLLNFHNESDTPPFSGNGGYSSINEAVPLLMPLPMYSYDVGKGLAFSLAGVGLYSGASFAQATGAPNVFRNTLYNVSWKLNMEATYEIYRDARLNSTDRDYRTFKPYSFQEIAFASFTPEAILNPVNLVVVPLYTLGAVAGSWEKAKTSSVFATGRTYFNDMEFDPWIAAPVSMAMGGAIAVQNSFEEAYWRGFVYEELKYSFKASSGSLSWLPASIVSSSLFALWHIPMQGFGWGQVGIFVLGLIIDGGYETGGLPAAAAGHGLANAAAFMARWVMTAGVPEHPIATKVGPSPIKTSYTKDGFSVSLSIPDLLSVRL